MGEGIYLIIIDIGGVPLGYEAVYGLAVLFTAVTNPKRDKVKVKIYLKVRWFFLVRLADLLTIRLFRS